MASPGNVVTTGLNPDLIASYLPVWDCCGTKPSQRSFDEPAWVPNPFPFDLDAVPAQHIKTRRQRSTFTVLFVVFPATFFQVMIHWVILGGYWLLGTQKTSQCFLTPPAHNGGHQLPYGQLVRVKFVLFRVRDICKYAGKFPQKSPIYPVTSIGALSLFKHLLVGTSCNNRTGKMISPT